MKIAYITVKLPYGRQESFIIPEIQEMIRQGEEVIILPFRPDDEIFHKDAEALRAITRRVGLCSLTVLLQTILQLFRNPFNSLRIVSVILFNSRNITIALKNISAIPKGLYAARLFKQEKVQHIHAHWASTPSTVAYVASYLSNIPWSFTAHRWDIAENNILARKVTSASFARVISEKGKQKVIETITDGNHIDKIRVVHMGVNIPDNTTLGKRQQKTFTIICPANMVTIKGHKYLIEACRIIKQQKQYVRCIFAGDGPLEAELKSLINEYELSAYIDFAGRLPQDKLIDMYKNNLIDAVVLPSIVRNDGETEGIPVALMEAMAYGIPVISTDTGGIPELLKDAGIIVPEKDSASLARAIVKLMTDTSYYKELQRLGKDKIENQFNLSKTVSDLITLIKNE